METVETANEIQKRRVVIGRSKDVDIQVEDPTCHAVTQRFDRRAPRMGGSTSISTNGTEINAGGFSGAKAARRRHDHRGIDRLVFRRESEADVTLADRGRRSFLARPQDRLRGLSTCSSGEVRSRDAKTQQGSVVPGLILRRSDF